MPRHEPSVPAARLFEALPENVTTRPDGPEKEVLRAWREQRTFEVVEKARAGSPPFVFWEGPPTANGRPGIHHVLARTIKDAVCRFQTMQGRRVTRKAGWDTHGLPVELEVEKKLGISGKPQIEALERDPQTGKAGIARFNDECRKSVWTYKKEWEDLSERIGYWLDYEHPYVTYEPQYIESVWALLARLHRAGHVYRGWRIVPNCGRCGTSLSSHEMGQPGVYKDVVDPSVVVRFRIETPAPRMPQPERGEALLAWTTTPWTLTCNFALAVHPDREYVRSRVRRGDRSEVVWVVAERVAHVLPKEHEELDRRRGADLVGCRYEPLFLRDLGPQPETVPDEPDIEKQYRVYPAEFVTVEDGTGIVHQAAYGEDDWQLATSEQIPTNRGPGENGRFEMSVYRGSTSEPPVVASGTWFKDADESILSHLKERRLLFSSGKVTHSYPHCWRCSTPLFYFAAPAWYIRTTAIKSRMVELNRRIRWIPSEAGEKRFGEWLENNVDWNISRNRYWGTPLPFWACEQCEAEEAIGSLHDLKQRAGELPPGFDSHKPSIDEISFLCSDPTHSGCRGKMRRTKAVLDCWFDSGAMPFAQYGWPHTEGSRERLRDQFPADFIAEGLDQTRGWFYTLHAIGAFVTSLPDAGLPDGPAYRTCVVNGLVLDKDGVKMSKRLGNVVDPWKVIGDHGADALRWYLLSSGQPWQSKRFDPGGVLEVRRKFLGTLIHSYRFFAEYARLDGFDPRSSGIPSLRSRPEIDRWLSSRTQSLLRDVRERMSDYDLSGACRALEAFVVDDLSNWYIRRNRRRFWKSETGADKLAAFATLHTALSTTALLCAPILPFLAEMLWERLGATAGSVHVQVLPAADDGLIDVALEGSMRIVTRIVEMGRALRERAGLKIRQPLRAIHVRSSHEPSLAMLRAPFATELVLGELNIKGWGSLAADDGRLCRLRAKPNYRTLGKRVGARMKVVAARVEGLPADAIGRLRSGANVAVEADGEQVVLAPEDVQITVESQAEFDVETDGCYVVFLDTQLDEDLIVEGLARETINRINGLRKDSGLAVEDRIRLWVHAEGPPDLRKALDVHGELIRAEALALELTCENRPSEDSEGVKRQSFDLGGGRTLTVGLLKV